jgi:hypothetical protein
MLWVLILVMQCYAFAVQVYGLERKAHGWSLGGAVPANADLI